MDEKESAVLVTELDSSEEKEVKPEKETESEPEAEKEEETEAEKEASDPQKKEKKPLGVWAKTGISAGTFFVLFLLTVVIACLILLRGPSETMRDALVLSAKQASATKWLPGLFLGEETVKEIEESSMKVSFDVVAIEPTEEKEAEEEAQEEWKDCPSGVKLEFLSKPAFKAYLLKVRDPEQVFVGTSSDFKSGKRGLDIFRMAEKYNALAVINGGEFPDVGGVGDGGLPVGITFSQGKMVYSGATNRTFMGFTKDNRLVVSEGMTEKTALSLGIRDGVCFQTGNCLITNDGVNMTMHYADKNTGRAQRTAIGQRADGTVLLLVTDGRCASSLGATHNELIEIMLENGAVCAGKLDGGSSAQMYYRNYFDLYGVDTSTLDEYQRRGLVNTYKAFTPPRDLPTFFVVKGAEE